MKRITEKEYQICKKYNLLYDGKIVPKNLHPHVVKNVNFGRTFIRTRHGIFVTEGYNGIYSFLEKYEKMECGSDGNRE